MEQLENFILLIPSLIPYLLGVSYIYQGLFFFFFLSPLKHIPFDEPEHLSSNPSQTPNIHDYHRHLLRTWSTKLVMSECLSLSFESLCEL